MLISATTSSVPKLQVELEAIQTVMPLKVTDPRSTVQIEAKVAATSSTFNRQVHVVLYYHKASDEDSGYLVAGWLKESLGAALAEEPMLAGRLRRGEGEGGFEIVSNDGGVRLVEARIAETLAEFVGMREREEVEGELVSWEDGGDGDTRFCPLFCVQVTNFLCGGYSVGISCSLLVADPYFIISFLKRWANIHQKLVYKTNNSKLPIFYLPTYKPKNSSLTKQIGSDAFKARGKTLIFKTSVSKNFNEIEMNKALALQCIEEAEKKHCAKSASSFYLFEKELNGEVKVEKVERKGLMEKPLLELSCVNWDDLGVGKVTFGEGNKAVCVSNWINSIPGEGLVFLFSFSSGSVFEINIVVTLPIEPAV